MGVNLVVTGANCADWSDRGLGLPVQHFDTLEAAQPVAEQYVLIWQGAGFRRTPAGIWLRGSEWRLVMVVDVENGIQWRPKEVVR